MRDPSTGHFFNSEPSLQPLAYCGCYPLLVALILVEDWDHLVLCAFSHQHQTHKDVTIISFVGEPKHCSLERRQGKTHLPPAPALWIGELNFNNTPTMLEGDVIHRDPFWSSCQSLQALGNIPGASSHCLPLLLWGYPNFNMESLPVYLPWTPASC